LLDANIDYVACAELARLIPLKPDPCWNKDERKVEKGLKATYDFLREYLRMTDEATERLDSSFRTAITTL